MASLELFFYHLADDKAIICLPYAICVEVSCNESTRVALYSRRDMCHHYTY